MFLAKFCEFDNFRFLTPYVPKAKIENFQIIGISPKTSYKLFSKSKNTILTVLERQNAFPTIIFNYFVKKIEKNEYLLILKVRNLKYSIFFQADIQLKMLLLILTLLLKIEFHVNFLQKKPYHTSAVKVVARKLSYTMVH